MPRLVHDQSQAIDGQTGKRPHDDGPIHAGPNFGSVGGGKTVGDFADKDLAARFEDAFIVGLVGDDVASAGIDEHRRAVKGFAPKLATIVLRSPFGFLEVASGEVGIDGRGVLK